MKIRDRIKSFRRVPAKDLAPNPRNWRTHPKAQREAMRGVLAEIGYADACLARELPDGSLRLVDGHLRTETTPDQKIPTLILNITDEEERKLLAVLDPLASMAEADGDALGGLLREVQTDSDGLKGLLDSLASDHGIDLFAAGGEEEAPEPQIDRAAELQAEWKTELDQLWEIPGKAGVHRLLCGDSTKERHVGRVLDGAVPFIMVTDPPYGVEYDPEWREAFDLEGAKAFHHGVGRSKGKVQNDDRVEWTDAYKLAPVDVTYVWHAGVYAGEVAANLHLAGFEIRNQIVWRKQHFVFGRGAYHWQHEPCWYAVRKGQTSKWCGDRTQSTVWDIQNANPMGGSDREGKTTHGTEKPPECMARPIRNHGGPGDDVYDPFLGSGTTMVAAEQLGRICYGIEIEPKYVAVALQRMKDMGLEPRLAE